MNFTLVPNEAIDRMGELSAGALRLYLFLLRCRNTETGRAFPSIKVTAEAIDTHSNNVYRLRKELVAIGWVEFDGDEVKFLLGGQFSKNAKTSIDNKADGEFSKNAKPIRKNAKGFSKNAKNFSKNANAYKEQQDELTILKEQPSAVAPDGLSSRDCYALFVEVRTQVGGYEVPYQNEVKDFAQLARLLKTCAQTNWTLTADRFRRAALHYFATPRSSHTLADLAAHFSDFFKNAFDRFGKPVEEVNGNGKHQVPYRETPGERTGREYEDLVRRSVAATVGDIGPDTADAGTQGLTIEVRRL